MRISKDNYFSNVLEQLRPIATLVSMLVALPIIAGILLALGSANMSDTAMLFMLMFGGGILVGVTTKSINNAFGFLGITKSGGAASTLTSSDTKHLQGAVKYPTKKENIFDRVALNVGQMTALGGAVPFPFGDGYLTMTITLFITITAGSMSGAIAEGELLFLKNVYMKTDKHGPIIDNVSGRALFRRAEKVSRQTPYKDAIAASSATYVVTIPIHFKNPRLRRPEDTLLDMAGVTSLDLQITLGNLSDMFGTTTGGAVSATADISIEKTLVPVDLGNHPVRQPYLAPINPWDPSVQQNVELPKTADLGILDLMILTTDSATAGVPWSGTPTANVIKKFTFQDNVRTIFDNVDVNVLKNDNKQKFNYSTMPTGLFIFDFIEEGSIWQGYAVGGRAKVNLNWINDTLSTSQVSGLIDGTLNLKNLKP